MTDIHAHLLPTADDGSASFHESIMMLETAYKSGVKNVVVTPHCNHPEHEDNYYSQWYIDTFKTLQQDAAKTVPVTIYPGMEIFLTTKVPALLEERKLISINSSRYMLVEFAWDEPAENITYLIEPLIKKGQVPIIAHPERYSFVIRDADRVINTFLDMGCILQVNKGSLLGRFGRNSQRISWYMLKKGYVHIVASDAHSPYQRTTCMTDAYNLVCSEYDRKYADMLFKVNPEKIINNENIIQRKR